MGKKGKPDEPEQYEVWIQYLSGEWKQALDHGNPVFVSRPKALLTAESLSNNKEVVETLVFSRRVIASFNGEAISMKHRLNAVSKKEEKPDEQPQVHGPSPDPHDVPTPGH